jgi:hypothetical protein
MTPAERYDGLCDSMLREPDVTIGRALSNEGLMVRGKLFAFLRNGVLVVKLPGARIDGLAADGRAVRALMGKRVMKEWVELAAEADWAALAAESRGYVLSLTGPQ